MPRAIEYQRLLETLSDDSLPLDGTHRQHNLLAYCPRGGHRDDTVTDKGRERFSELMDEAAALPARVDFGCLPILANITLVSEEKGRALIDELIETHLGTAKRVDGMVPSYDRLEARATMELCSATYRLVAEHLERFKQDLYGKP